jgi:hypothetical protein
VNFATRGDDHEIDRTADHVSDVFGIHLLAQLD